MESSSRIPTLRIAPPDGEAREDPRTNGGLSLGAATIAGSENGASADAQPAPPARPDARKRDRRRRSANGDDPSESKGPYPAPLNPVQDAILIIYSVKGTSEDDRKLVEGAVNSYRRQDIRIDRKRDPGRYVETSAKVFRIPDGANPGATLTTELTSFLKICVGAIAFVDDLRPNIAYELGFFHGKGAPVLLLTKDAPSKSWDGLSDLAGAAFAQFDPKTVRATVHSYLNGLFRYLETVDRWPTYALPQKLRNLLLDEDVELFSPKDDFTRREDPLYGAVVTTSLWNHPLNLLINATLSVDARFKVALRSMRDVHYSMYFEIGFHDAGGQERQIWLGLSSWLYSADYRNDERNLPADPVSRQWRYVTGTFAGLLRQGCLHNIGNMTLKRIRFRAGLPHSSERIPLEIGYVDICGIL